MYAAVTEPLAGIKPIKTLGIEAFFLERFRRHVVRLGRLARRNGLLGQSLKPLLELLIVLGLLGPIGFMLAHGLPVVDMVPILAVFGTAAYRLMPSFVRMTNILQNLQFVRPVIALVHRDLAQAEQAPPSRQPVLPAPSLRNDIRLEGIGFAYEGTDEPVLTDITMTIRRGQSIALVGASGAGKTTLVDIILGLLQPTTGRILLDGRELPPGCRPQLLGYVPQDSFLINDTVRRNIALGAGTIDEAALRRAVTTAALDDFIAELPDGLDTMVGERGLRLSGGQRQRLAIARALYHRTDVLILDESTSSLDATTEAAVSEAIHRLKEIQTLIIIAHRLSTVRDCDRLFFMQAGRIVDEGNFAELLARNAAFRAMVRQMELTTPDAPALRSMV
jgi:ABC-type multidrug transport system fused ATPase/permease subunit